MIKPVFTLKNSIVASVFFLVLFFLVFTASVYASIDLLEQAFDPAIKQNWLINLGDTKDDVGNEVLRESTNISLNTNWWQLFNISTKAPLIVRIAKLLLRITIVLSVTMVLYNWVLYIIQSSKWESPKDPQKNLINILIWILLALASLWIINLLSSITISSLKTSSDVWFLNNWWDVKLTKNAVIDSNLKLIKFIQKT